MRIKLRCRQPGRLKWTEIFRIHGIVVLKCVFWLSWFRAVLFKLHFVATFQYRRLHPVYNVGWTKLRKKLLIFVRSHYAAYVYRPQALFFRPLPPRLYMRPLVLVRHLRRAFILQQNLPPCLEIKIHAVHFSSLFYRLVRILL